MEKLRVFGQLMSVRKPHILRILVGLGAFACIYLYLSQFHDALIDDAYITFQYARNLRDHQNWGIFPETTTNTATSPLNIILTAGASVIFEDIVDAGIWLAAIEATILLAVLGLISKRIFNQYHFGIAGFLVTMLNPLVVSSIGLETLLFLVLICMSLYLFQSDQWHWLAMILALLTLTRADGILLFLILGGYLLKKRAVSKSRKILFLCIYLFSLAPWYVFSWFSLGSLIPDTFFLKFNQSWKGFSYVSGLALYLFRYPSETVFSFILAPMGVLYVLRNKKKTPQAVMFLCLFGCLYFSAYSFLRVPPYHWYYTPVAFSLNLAGVYAIFAVLQGREKKPKREQMKIFYLAGVIGYLGVGLWLVGFGRQPIQEPPIHTNYATATEYREIGLWLKQNIDETKKVKLAGEIGTVAFYSQRQLIDMFSCRYEMQPRISRLYQQGGWIEKMARINFSQFDPGEPCWPNDYLLGSLATENESGPGMGELIETWTVSTRWIPKTRVFLWKLPNP